MRLKEISVFGFKSFKEKTTLRFDTGITAVVGPNGSGKSNVADAVRWVLGEQKSGLIRAKKLEDVIFFGSRDLPKSSFAEVMLVFDNDTKNKVLPYAELKVSRRYYRSGESEYSINGSKCRLADVALTLARAGIVKGGYSVIGQGMVDVVLAASPEERKEFFDEAAGIKILEIKREQGRRRMHQIRENLDRAHDILAELEPRLKLLTRTIERQKEREEVSRELHAQSKDYYSFMLKKYGAELAANAVKKEVLSKEVFKIEEEVEALTESLKGLEALKNDKAELSRKRDSVREELIIAESRAKIEQERSNYNLVEAFYAEKNDLTKEAQKLEQTKAAHTTEAEKAKEVLAGLSAELTRIEQEVDELRQKNSEFSRLLKPSELAADLKSAIKHVEAGALDKALTGLKKLLGELNRLDQGEMDDVNAKIAKSEQAATGVRLNIKNAEITLSRVSEAAKFVGSRLTDIEAKTKDISANIQKLGAAAGITVDESRIKELKDELSSVETKLGALERNIIKTETANLGLYERQVAKHKIEQEASAIAIAEAKTETRLEDLKAEIEELEPAIKDVISADLQIELDEPRAVKAKIDSLKAKLLSLGGVDLEAGAEYEEVKSRHEHIKVQTDDLNAAMKHFELAAARLDELIKTRFTESFKNIDTAFKEFFQILFGGGDAELSLAENEDTGRLGIDIIARPPGKKIQHLGTLSGGERTLTSIALLCSFLKVNPAPFVVLDEVDAALDEINTLRFLKAVKELAETTQFVVVTHNKQTMKESRVLYGITMNRENASQVISVKLEEAKEFAHEGVDSQGSE